jgi:hypothetical protein
MVIPLTDPVEYRGEKCYIGCMPAGVKDSWSAGTRRHRPDITKKDTGNMVFQGD